MANKTEHIMSRTLEHSPDMYTDQYWRLLNNEDNNSHDHMMLLTFVFDLVERQQVPEMCYEAKYWKMQFYFLSISSREDLDGGQSTSLLYLLRAAKNVLNE